MLDNYVRAVHKVRNSVIWKSYGENSDYGYYYAESRIYLVRNMKKDILTIVVAESPSEALQKVLTGHLD